MNSKVPNWLILGIIIIFLFFHSLALSFAEVAKKCAQPVGRLVSLQGEAQVLREGLSGWQVIGLNATLCTGDMMRVLRNGRAAVVLNNETVLRIDQKSTLKFLKPSVENSSILELLYGVLHIFSHRSRSLKVVTPYVNGVVEGTEFLVSVDDDTSVITVFDGAVAAVNELGQLYLSSGRSARARKGAAPTFVAIVRPRDAVEWTLYYPAIVKLSATLSKEDKADPVRRAAADLFIGRVDEAREVLAKILHHDPENSDALALLSIIETVLNNKDDALELALRAIQHSPKSASANLALSYAYQALFDISAALKVLQQAAGFTPGNGLVQAKLAELFLSVGELESAQVAASEAVFLNPEIGLSHTVLGFTFLSRMEIDEALAAFDKAIMLDSVMPLARLGLGLAKIRMGRLEEGRADLEIAAALDPGNALIRSYLGKAYFDEKRDNQARRQYEIAKQLDPADPTPWFYDAIRKQTINRPVEALHDLQQSIARNDNRAVYRSRLLLDDDLASRSAGLGRIYTDLGFQQLAHVEGVKSIQSDPANYSAHRFLADTYSNSPRHEIARVSELLQSQLLQPLNVTPVQPRLAESNLSILEGTGPASSSFNEFNPLFLRDRVMLQTSGVAGSNDILADELALSGVHGRLSYSLGQFHYQTDGIRDNNDQEQNIYNSFFQAMISPTTSLMTELRYREKNFGDDIFQFDPADFSRTLRQYEKNKSARLGFRHDLKPNSSILGTAVISSDDDEASTGNDGFSLSVDLISEVESEMVEMQHIYKGKRFNLQSGAGHLNADETFSTLISFPFESFTKENTDSTHTNMYSYAQIDLPHNTIATLGFSGDLLDSPRTDRNEFSPKLGLTWHPMETMLIRAAAFKTVTRRFIHAQTIEPTFVAGFNQFFDDGEGTVYWTYGLGVDQTFPAGWHGGLQYYYRDLSVPYIDYSLLGDIVPKEDDWQEDVGSAYLYWAPANWITLGLEYNYEQFTHDKFEGRGFRDLKTHRITQKIQLFYPCGLSARLQASYLDQKGEFGSPLVGYEKDNDQFWTVDFSISYRLPKRYGILRVEITNLFDEQFQFFDTDPANPGLLSEQQVIGSLTIAF